MGSCASHAHAGTNPALWWLSYRGTGRSAAMLWEEALPAQAAAYNPKITASIPKLMERGEEITRIRYSLPD